MNCPPQKRPRHIQLLPTAPPFPVSPDTPLALVSFDTPESCLSRSASTARLDSHRNPSAESRFTGISSVRRDEPSALKATRVKRDDSGGSRDEARCQAERGCVSGETRILNPRCEPGRGQVSGGTDPSPRFIESEARNSRGPSTWKEAENSDCYGTTENVCAARTENSGRGCSNGF